MSASVKYLARALVSLALAAGTLAGLAGTVSPATSSAATGSCTSTSGVTVVVDFTALRGHVERGCAPGAPATGLAALKEAGFLVAGTEQYGDAFVCRINGLPDPGQQSCETTPPANAYWAYFHAVGGATTWSFSALGAASYTPPPGSIDGWAFGSGAPPSVPPQEVTTTTTTTTAATTTTTANPIQNANPGVSTPGSSGQSTGATQAPTSVANPIPSTSPTDLPPGSTPVARTKTTGPFAGESINSTTGTTTTSAPRIVNVTPSKQVAALAAAHGGGGGSGTGVLVGLVLVVVLGAAGVLVTLRRRRRDSPGDT
jgi:hypothetical protein